MKITIVILAVLTVFIIGAIIGWKARTWKDEFDESIDRIFYEAFKKME